MISFCLIEANVLYNSLRMEFINQYQNMNIQPN